MSLPGGLAGSSTPAGRSELLANEMSKTLDGIMAQHEQRRGGGQGRGRRANERTDRRAQEASPYDDDTEDEATNATADRDVGDDESDLDDEDDSVSADTADDDDDDSSQDADDDDDEEDARVGSAEDEDEEDEDARADSEADSDADTRGQRQPLSRKQRREAAQREAEKRVEKRVEARLKAKYEEDNARIQQRAQADQQRARELEQQNAARQAEDAELRTFMAEALGTPEQYQHWRNRALDTSLRKEERDEAAQWIQAYDYNRDAWGKYRKAADRSVRASLANKLYEQGALMAGVDAQILRRGDPIEAFKHAYVVGQAVADHENKTEISKLQKQVQTLLSENDRLKRGGGRGRRVPATNGRTPRTPQGGDMPRDWVEYDQSGRFKGISDDVLKAARNGDLAQPARRHR